MAGLRLISRATGDEAPDAFQERAREIFLSTLPSNSGDRGTPQENICRCVTWVLQHTAPALSQSLKERDGAIIDQADTPCIVCGGRVAMFMQVLAKCRKNPKLHIVRLPVCLENLECSSSVENSVAATAGMFAVPASSTDGEFDRAVEKAKDEYVLSSASCFACKCARLLKDDTVPALKMCGKCKRVYYCSAACQRSNWPFHKKMCKLFTGETPFPDKWKSTAQTTGPKPALESRCECMSDAEYGAIVNGYNDKCCWYKCNEVVGVCEFESHITICPRGTHYHPTAFHSASCRRKFLDATGHHADVRACPHGDGSKEST